MYFYMLTITEDTGVCADMPCCWMTPVSPIEHSPHYTKRALVSTIRLGYSFRWPPWIPSEQAVSRAVCLLWPVDTATAVIIHKCNNDTCLIIQPGIKNISNEDSGLLGCDAVSLGG
jgi:hypothetical protein